MRPRLRGFELLGQTRDEVALPILTSRHFKALLQPRGVLLRLREILAGILLRRITCLHPRAHPRRHSDNEYSEDGECFRHGEKNLSDHSTAPNRARALTERPIGAVVTALSAPVKLSYLTQTVRSFWTFVIARCAQRTVALQLDCFVTALLAT